MRIVVTGGHGFLGRYVVMRLQDAGHEIIIPRSESCDLRSQDNVIKLMRDNRPEAVIHLAARVGGIGANARCPADFIYDNLAMGANVIHQSYVHNVKKFVLVGTTCSYPKHTPVPFKEADLWNGYPEKTNAPYGLAKRILIEQCAAYRRQHGFNAVTLIPTNLYGPGDNSNSDTSHVIPAIFKKCLQAIDLCHDHITLWGDGTPTRDFLFVDDAARAIVTAMDSYNDEQPVNLGTGQETSISHIASLIIKITGFGGRIEWDISKPNGQPRRCLDTSLAKDKLGFEATTTLESGLMRYYENLI